MTAVLGKLLCVRITGRGHPTLWLGSALIDSDAGL